MNLSAHIGEIGHSIILQFGRDETSKLVLHVIGEEYLITDGAVQLCRVYFIGKFVVAGLTVGYYELGRFQAGRRIGCQVKSEAGFALDAVCCGEAQGAVGVG